MSEHPGRDDDSPRILMAAGEVSGDRQGGYLAQAILCRDPAARLFGSGGERMSRAGVDVRVESVRYGSVGIQESISFFRPLRGVMSELRGIVVKERPHLAVLIDNEGFNTVLARFLHGQGVPFISYFPPQVWLWGGWRARRIAERATAIISAFSAEAGVYRQHSDNVAWFGHPLLDIVRPHSDRATALTRLGLDPAARTVCLMPGSRYQEIERLARPIVGAARILGQRYPDLQFVLPLSAEYLRPQVTQAIEDCGMTRRVVLVAEDHYSCVNASELVLLSSGTATLEAALLGVPMVVGYRVTALTHFVARRLVRFNFIAMPNILLGERVVPELLQDEITSERFASEAARILEQPDCARQMRDDLGRVRRLLGKEGALDNAASMILREARRSSVGG
jgi:lipid-A-disaccharide synthase